jgi:hypothetical protein
MGDTRTINGKWVVIGLIALGLVAAVAGLKFRQWPGDGTPATSQRTER